MIVTKCKTNFDNQKGGTQVFKISPAPVISAHGADVWMPML